MFQQKNEAVIYLSSRQHIIPGQYWFHAVTRLLNIAYQNSFSLRYYTLLAYRWNYKGPWTIDSKSEPYRAKCGQSITSWDWFEVDLNWTRWSLVSSRFITELMDIMDLGVFTSRNFQLTWIIDQKLSHNALCIPEDLCITNRMTKALLKVYFLLSSLAFFPRLLIHSNSKRRQIHLKEYKVRMVPRLLRDIATLLKRVPIRDHLSRWVDLDSVSASLLVVQTWPDTTLNRLGVDLNC
jgi:hypothetical protein